MQSPMMQIFAKEAREMFRDKRVRSGAIVMPIVMMLVLIFIFGFITDTLKKPQNIKVSVIGSGQLVDPLKKAEVQVSTLKTVDEAKEKIRKGEVRVALEIPTGTPTNGQQIIRAYFDPKDDKAKINVSQLGAVFSKVNQVQLEQLVVSKGLPKEMAEPIKFEEVPVSVGEDEGASALIISLLPYIIVLYAFYGGMGSVGDLVAGEKEKMTLETLLITPVSRRDIALGKFWALAVLCLVSSLSAAVGLVIAGMLKLDMLADLFPRGTGITPTAFGLTLIALLPAVGLFSALMLAISTKAKNMREAQTQLTMLSLVVLLPAMFSQFIGLTDFAKASWVNAVPVLNTATAIRTAMQGKVELDGLAIGVAINGLLAVIAIFWAIKLFKQEEVLVRV